MKMTKREAATFQRIHEKKLMSDPPNRKIADAIRSLPKIAAPEGLLEETKARIDKLPRRV